MKDIKNFLESKGAVIHDKHLEEDDEDEDTVTEDHNRQGMYSVISIKCTIKSKTNHPPRRDERRFLYFNHLFKEFLEQMIPHLKALI